VRREHPFDATTDRPTCSGLSALMGSCDNREIMLQLAEEYERLGRRAFERGAIG
jgi:hypothetical protein